MSEHEEKRQETVPEIPIFLKETTPEQQIEKVEHSTTILKRMEKKVDGALSNLDTGAGAGSAALYVIAGGCLSTNDYKNGAIFLACAILIDVLKLRIPEGAFKSFLRSKQDKIVKDVAATLTHKRAR